MVDWGKLAKLDAISVELKVLERLIGNWNASLVYKPAEWTPTEVKTNRTYQGEWALDGQLVYSTAKDSDGTESLFLWSFDPQAKRFKLWRFTSTGQTSKMSGTWDAASETMTLKSTLPNGLDFLMTVHLPENHSQHWNGIVTDQAGKVYFNMDGQGNRRKE